MRRTWISASAGLAIILALGAAGCLSDAIKQNQQQIDQQKVELDQLKQQIADLKAAQQPSYPTTAPPPGSCDKAVMEVATKHGGERFAVTACPTSAQAQLNVARAYEAMGDNVQAVDHYRRAIQAAPSDHDADPAVAEQARQAVSRLAAK
jgi:tetratricopeptide (TPR) repeat protein